MPAKSKSQQRFFGMVDAYKKGDMPDASQAIKDAAKEMTPKEVKKFAKTKHKGLPEKVKKKKKTLNESARELRRVQNKIFRLVNSKYGGMFSDQDWHNVHDLINDVENLPEVESCDWGVGTYFNYGFSKQMDKSPYRDYQWLVNTIYGPLKGYIRCCAAGTMEDPFEHYDIVISLYPCGEDDTHIEESKMKFSNSDIEYLVNESVKRILNIVNG